MEGRGLTLQSWGHSYLIFVPFFFRSKGQSQVRVELPGRRLPLLCATSWEGHWWHPLWSEWHSHLCLGTVQGKCHWAWESVVWVFNLWLMVSQGWSEPACRLRAFGLWEYRRVMLAFQSLTGLFAHCILHRGLDTRHCLSWWCLVLLLHLWSRGCRKGMTVLVGKDVANVWVTL